MGNSDDIVLLLERDPRTASNDAVVIGANDAFRRASGYPNDQLLGRTVTELFPNRNEAATLMEAIRGAGSLRAELACGRANADPFILGMHLMCAPARAPGRDCFVVLGRDITEAVQARKMQDSIQRLLAKVFSAVDAGVAIINAAGRIVMTNPHLDVLLGYGPNGLVDRTLMEVMKPDSGDRIAAMLKQQIADGRDVCYSAPVLRADQSWLTVRIMSVIATTGDAKFFRVVTLRPSAHDPPAIRCESAGRIKLVGLDEVRTALGDRWPAAAERAMATAEAVIKRRCGPQDSYARADDNSFLMCFGALSEEEASFRAAMISREIRTRLIGQGEDPDVAYVSSVTAMVRFSDEGASQASVQTMLLNGLDKQIERLEREARQTLHSAVTNATCELEPVFGRNPSQIVASQVSIPYKLDRRLVSALAVLPQAESKTFDLNGLLIGLAAQQAVASLGQGEAIPLLVRINFNVFTSRAMAEPFFATCAKVDSRVANRLILLLTSMPDGLPRTRLQECVNRLRPFCRAVGFQVDEMADLRQIDLSNSYNPIVVLPMTACSAATPAKLKELFSSLQSQRAKVLIREVGSERDAAALRSLGVDLILMKRSPS